MGQGPARPRQDEPGVLRAQQEGRVLLLAAPFLLSEYVLSQLHFVCIYAIVGFGAAAYAPAKYGILTELLPPEKLVAANGWIEGTTIASIILGTLLGGALIAPKVSVVPAMGVEVIVLAFAVVVIGGLGSLPGAALGAVIVGLVRSAAVHYWPEVELFSIYLVMALVLIARPRGLFSTAEPRKI